MLCDKSDELTGNLRSEKRLSYADAIMCRYKKIHIIICEPGSGLNRSFTRAKVAYTIHKLRKPLAEYFREQFIDNSEKILGNSRS